MDFGGLLLLGFLWVVFNLLTKGRQQQGERPSKLPTRLPPAAPPSRGDPTQREGSRLEALLREFERALEQGAGSGPLGRPPRPADGEAGRRETWKRNRGGEPETAVAGLSGPRSARMKEPSGWWRVDRQPMPRQHHTRWMRRRPAHPAADATAVRARPEQLRRAVVWREVLGPPVALRDQGR
jgi:hypothetical protein